MKHSEFEIGMKFNCGGKLWKCTDKGTRTIIAIDIRDHQHYNDNISWFAGPPYAKMERVFDETDFKGCTL